MVIYFDEGINRVFYRPPNFGTGLTIAIQLWDAHLQKRPLRIFKELEEGLYYLDYDFNQRGNWVGIVYENGEKETSQTFQIGMARPGVIKNKLPK